MESVVPLDAIFTAFEDKRFYESYKATIHKATWCSISENNARQKDLIDKLRNAEKQLQLIFANKEIKDHRHKYISGRKQIMDIFIELLRHEMKFCRQNNIEQFIWKILYYNLIECARRLINTDIESWNKIHRQLCLNLIEEGTQFFNHILNILSKNYNFRLVDFIGIESGRNLKGLKYISLALVSSQKCLMYLGDLARYRSLVEESTNFSEAEQWYTKAHQLIPLNGMPLNQLAILALYNKKNFNAIFYHMCSLNASNPIKSARESLIILFDELRKKYQSQIINQTESIQGKTYTTNHRFENFKKEIWVHPTDGQLNYRMVYFDREDEQLDIRGLYKSFILNFSHLHGIFFTKVGVDSLEICMDQTLKQFQELFNNLSSSSSVVSFKKIIQMIILNIYSIENNVNTSNNTCLLFALSFSFTFIAIILNKMQDELNEFITTRNLKLGTCIDQMENFNLTDNINNSLGALSIWCNWMKVNWHLWTSDNFLTTIHKYTDNFGLNIWDDFARLVMAFEKLNTHVESIILMVYEEFQNDTQYKRIRLPEDMISLGIQSLIRSDYVYCKKDLDNKLILFKMRWQNIYNFCTQELMKEENSFLRRLDFGEIIAMQRFDSKILYEEILDRDGIEGGTELERNLPSHEIATVKFQGNNDDKCDQNNSSEEIIKLLERRNELQQTHKIQNEQTKFTQKVLKQTKSQTIYMEIRPKYLITDTNCFIDFLPQIQQLSQLYPLYNVLIPITVLNELEGLAKGECNSKVSDTNMKTTRNALEALELLKTSSPNIKCVTTRGSILNSMAFTKESDCQTSVDGRIEQINNDDKILLTAINLTKIYSNDLVKEMKPIHSSNLQRKVVLLTNDRNLKLKAITQNIPVRELIDFIKWSEMTRP